MLEKYIEGMTTEKAVRMAMEKSGAKNRAEAMEYLRKSIPKESYFQKKIKDALAKKYPQAYVAKIAQGYYSYSGIPDIMFIMDGRYFGFEVKRPIFGKASAIQEQTIIKLREAGAVAEVVSYPEEAIKVVDDWIWKE
ncbi:MAG: VRR-NUC domain-containing protein [Clostridiales bacterium]|nr:VRR-NUC domain-containing protein [Clostridiales bacterium]